MTTAAWVWVVVGHDVVVLVLVVALARGWRPVTAARSWARWYVYAGQPADTGRLRRLRMVAAPLVWPEPFVHALWVRARTGAWPTPAAKRTAAPAMVVRRGDER